MAPTTTFFDGRGSPSHIIPLSDGIRDNCRPCAILSVCPDNTVDTLRKHLLWCSCIASIEGHLPPSLIAAPYPDDRWTYQTVNNVLYLVWADDPRPSPLVTVSQFEASGRAHTVLQYKFYFRVQGPETQPPMSFVPGQWLAEMKEGSRSGGAGGNADKPRLTFLTILAESAVLPGGDYERLELRCDVKTAHRTLSMDKTPRVHRLTMLLRCTECNEDISAGFLAPLMVPISRLPATGN